MEQEAKGWLSRIGPAIVVAAVVLGPGSILTSSKVGCQYGYSTIWIVVAAGLLMVGATGLSARLGTRLSGSLCDEITHQLGRPVAVLIGTVLFLIVAAFQSSNNIAVVAALDPLLPAPPEDGSSTSLNLLKGGILIGVNVIVIAAVYGMSQFYAKLEKLMIALMVIMVVGFGVNLVFARPNLFSVMAGLIPKIPSTGEGVDSSSALAVFGLIGTTYSIAGAFYQSYLVREKGWNKQDDPADHLVLTDAFVGIAALGLTTIMIMTTAAAVLAGKTDPSELKSVADVARQLQPLFGDSAAILFIGGIFAGAFSSFLVNATIGGVLFSDGLGWGASLDDKWPKRFTILALLSGMGVALAVVLADWNRVTLIVIAQALTVLGGPVLALSLLYLALSPKSKKVVNAPLWMIILMAAGLVCSTVIAYQTAIKVKDKIQNPSAYVIPMDEQGAVV